MGRPRPIDYERIDSCWQDVDHALLEFTATVPQSLADWADDDLVCESLRTIAALAAALLKLKEATTP